MKPWAITLMLGIALVSGLFLAMVIGCGDEEQGTLTCVDVDGDGYGANASPLCAHPEIDCDDYDSSVHPAARERCSNGIDDNCDGATDHEDSACAYTSFSFVIIADPHIEGDPDHDARLVSCINWINTHRKERQIELVILVGDIAWGDDNPERAKDMLDPLSVPYVPLIGDNEIQSGSEQDFYAAFLPHYARLAEELDNWSKMPTPVWSPHEGKEAYLQNVSFDHRGVHFVGLDWCTRKVAPIVGEQADLHGFPGGTFDWFKQDIEGCAKPFKEHVVMASHHPMHFLPIGAFSVQEQRALEQFTSQYRDAIYANFAGHYHLSVHNGLRTAGYEIFLTQSTWVAENALRLVTVDYAEDRILYTSSVVPVHQ